MEPKAPRKRTRIQQANERKIVDGALSVFSTYGYRGSTIDQIAEAAEMSKPNLLYYFRRKEDIYRAVLDRTLVDWLAPLRDLTPTGEPEVELATYIRRKLEMSRTNPTASRLFANEILAGAPLIGETLAGPLRELVEEKAAVIKGWVDAGKLKPVDPKHLIFAIWATTQHYADFETQIRAILGAKADETDLYAKANDILTTLFVDGLTPPA